LSSRRPAVKGAIVKHLVGISHAHRLNAALAQVVEHIIRNDGVRGSSPLSGTTHFLIFGCLRFAAMALQIHVIS
jgi:hypothetical protein